MNEYNLVKSLWFKDNSERWIVKSKKKLSIEKIKQEFNNINYKHNVNVNEKEYSIWPRTYYCFGKQYEVKIYEYTIDVVRTLYGN